MGEKCSWKHLEDSGQCFLSKMGPESLDMAGNCSLFGLCVVFFLEKELPPSRAACLGRGTGRD